MIVVLFVTATFVAAAPPNVTVAPAAKFVPVMVTAVPPAAGPVAGLTLLTVGPTTYVNPLARLPLCPLTVTVTVMAPAVPAGVVAVIVVLFVTTTFVAAALPNVTVAPATKFVPVMVTAVPPAVDPVFGTNAAHRRRYNIREAIRQASTLSVHRHRHGHGARTACRSRGRDCRAVCHHHIRGRGTPKRHRRSRRKVRSRNGYGRPTGRRTATRRHSAHSGRHWAT